MYKTAEVSLTHELKARDHFTRGMFYELENKHENALIEFYQALLYDSTSSTVYNRIAENHMSLGRYESALRYLQKSLKLQPEEPETIRFIADCHYRLKDDEKAINNLKRVLEIDPLDENARSLLLLLYRKNGNYIGLAKQYEQMINIYGEDEDWVRKAATIYLKNGQVDEALALFKLYVEADSGNAGMWYSVGMAYELKEQSDDA
ncbi:MAG: tetratricopeptide repeat protein, partial [Calditrichia bacterium]|nr:tetratricopeptide repeat protein [Calditrichia bacterium]